MTAATTFWVGLSVDVDEDEDDSRTWGASSLQQNLEGWLTGRLKV